MALITSENNNLNSLFNTSSKNLNFTERSANDLQDLVKSLNIINPEKLSKEQLSIILQRIDDYNGFFTTQQLENVDYLNFNEHVFFDSAANKVSYSFDRIQNIPYDKDEITSIEFFNKTDGFTNYLLKNIYPKNKGYIKFSGNDFVVIYDEQGKVLTDTKQRNFGLLNPKNNNFSFDFWINPDNVVTDNQVVFHKTRTITSSNDELISEGFLCFLTNNNDKFNLHFLIYIDDNFIEKSIVINKNEWQHVVINISNKNIDQTTQKAIEFVLNSNLVDTINVTDYSENRVLQNKSFSELFRNKNIPLCIGKIFIPKSDAIKVSVKHRNLDLQQGFLGNIDEFRMFHKNRSLKVIKKEMHKNIFAQRGLNLYLRFNEPKPLQNSPYTNNFLCIDYSGNKIHGIFYEISGNSISIKSNTYENRFENDSSVYLKLEKAEDSPVVNSAHPDVKSIRLNLMTNAQKYDENNPNLIFNLMPRHYFLDNSDLQGLPVYSNNTEYQDPEAILVDSISDYNSSTENNIKVSNRSTLNTSIPASNDLVNIVLIWARFFDQLKIYISSITNLLNVNYDTINENNIIGMQIPILCKMYGIDFKEILPTITKSKLDNENLNFDDIISEMSIRKIQNILWKRFLINTQDFLRSKGTVKSIESAFNAFGIDYSKLINIKEHSYNNEISLDNNFTLSEDKLFAVNFGSSKVLTKDPVFTANTTEYSDNKLFLTIENIKRKNSTNQNLIQVGNANLVSGLGDNWSIEVFFNFKDAVNKRYFLNQSKTNQVFSTENTYKDSQYLFVLNNTANDAVTYVKFYKNNKHNSNLGSLVIKVKPVTNDDAFNKAITINNVNLFDLPKYFCLSQKRDENKLTYTATISDIGNQIVLKDKKSSSASIEVTDLSNKINNSPSLYSFNSDTLSLNIGDYQYASNQSINSEIESGNFQGEILKIRLWNKCLEEEEIKSHFKDIENFGTNNLSPLKNIISDFKIKISDRLFNNPEYSWQINDNANNIYWTNNEKTVSSFVNSCFIKTKNDNINNNDAISNISIISKRSNSNFDEINTNNKVNIISYRDVSSKNLTNNSREFPANKMPFDYDYENTNRVSIDMSIVKTLNNDISKIISDINTFTQKVTSSTLKFEYTYKSIDSLREEFFQKFSEKDYINYASLGNIFKYFDNIMSSILHDIVPSRVRFEGFNFVYESHLLERHKYQYQNKDSIKTISPSMLLNSNNANSDSFINFSRKKIKSRRNVDYNNNRFKPSSN